jgi:inosine/xanthosine triphosphate pyrophosphatase family protein
MGEMKSALERALERAEQLGKLSPEEMRKKREEEYITIGEGLAKRYLEHGYVGIFTEQINNYSSEGKSIVTKSALSTLVQSVGLEDSDLTKRALQGIPGLRSSKQIENTCQEIEDILGEYYQAKQQQQEKEKATIEKSVREALHRRRISGSAVGEINAQTSEAWKEIVDELQSQFDGRLDELKKSLAEALDQI